jgi:hypothetical protein
VSERPLSERPLKEQLRPALDEADLQATWARLQAPRRPRWPWFIGAGLAAAAAAILLSPRPAPAPAPVSQGTATETRPAEPRPSAPPVQAATRTPVEPATRTTVEPAPPPPKLRPRRPTVHPVAPPDPTPPAPPPTAPPPLRPPPTPAAVAQTLEAALDPAQPRSAVAAHYARISDAWQAAGVPKKAREAARASLLRAPNGPEAARMRRRLAFR